MKLDIRKQAIPADVLISYLSKSVYLLLKELNEQIFLWLIGVLFTGKDKPVASEGEEPVLTASGEVRKGRDLAESTFRKHFHGLKAIHVHFQREGKYQVHCTNPYRHDNLRINCRNSSPSSLIQKVLRGKPLSRSCCKGKLYVIHQLKCIIIM